MLKNIVLVVMAASICMLVYLNGKYDKKLDRCKQDVSSESFRNSLSIQSYQHLLLRFSFYIDSTEEVIRKAKGAKPCEVTGTHIGRAGTVNIGQ